MAATVFGPLAVKLCLGICAAAIGSLRRRHRVRSCPHCRQSIKGVEVVEQVHADHFDRAAHIGSGGWARVGCSKLT